MCYIYIYKYIYTHTYIYIYTYICIYVEFLSFKNWHRIVPLDIYTRNLPFVRFTDMPA